MTPKGHFQINWPLVVFSCSTRKDLHKGFFKSTGGWTPTSSQNWFRTGLNSSTGSSQFVSLSMLLISSFFSSLSITLSYMRRASNSFAAVTFRIRGNLWHKNMLSWIIHFCTVVGFSQGSRLQNTSTEVTSLLGSPHFVISFLTNLKISNENSSVGRIGWSQPAVSNFSSAFNSGSVIRSFFLWS